MEVHADDKYTVGFKLLSKFQDQWAILHENNKINVQKANDAISRIQTIDQATTRQLHAIDSLVTGYNSLDLLNEQMRVIESDLLSLETKFSRIENLLIDLRNKKEQSDSEQFLVDTTTDYASRFQKLKSSSDARRATLRVEHMCRVEQFERQMQSDLDERRNILSRAFEEEKHQYLSKTHGSSDPSSTTSK